MTLKRNKTFLWIAAFASLFAILDHAYLLSEHYDLRFGEATTQGLCNISDYISCAAVSASRYSELFGIPMALWGIVGNSALLLLVVWAELTGTASQKATRLRILALASGIAVASVVMAIISTFIIAHLCPFCIVAYVLSLLTFVTCFLATRTPADDSNGKSKAQSTAPDSKLFQAVALPLVILGAASAVAAMLADDAFRKSYGARDLQPMIQEALQTWSSGAELKFTPVAPLVMGASDADAKMVITEFADFRCSHCKHAAPVFKAFVASHPDVQLRFEAWPLDGECNTSIPSTNGASCLLARSVNCVQKLNGKGWKAHEYIYENQETYVSADAVRGALDEIARNTGTDASALKTCTASPEAMRQLQDEAAVGSSLNLTGTPSVFVNGKKLPYGQNLQVLIEVHAALSRRD